MLPSPRPSRIPSAPAAVALALAAAAFAGCAPKAEDRGGPVPPARPEAVQAATVSMWRTQFETHRAQWEAVIAQSPDSPLPEERRASFPGLRFYAFDPAWRYVGDLQRLVPPAFIEIPDTKGETQSYLDYGRFPIERDGVVATLEVYRPVDHPDQFFIAFFDSTNGGDTYEGGRYVHLDSLDMHRFVLDFNKAYNPYCAYDSSWICPIPPRANALPFGVRAGMMAVGKP
jgi:uncharacterized protein (DUF1684 family)